MKIYENEHLVIYDQHVNNEEIYIIYPKNDSPAFALNKEDTQKLIKESSTRS